MGRLSARRSRRGGPRPEPGHGRRGPTSVPASSRAAARARPGARRRGPAARGRSAFGPGDVALAEEIASGPLSPWTTSALRRGPGGVGGPAAIPAAGRACADHRCRLGAAVPARQPGRRSRRRLVRRHPLLHCGRVAFVIGDVMQDAGCGLQPRWASSGPPYACWQCWTTFEDVLRHLDDLAQGTDQVQLATCVYAVYDPVDRLCRTRPPAIRRRCCVSRTAAPGCCPSPQVHRWAWAGSPSSSTVRVVDSGSRLLLYTDGLVESRDVDLDEGLAVLTESFSAGSGPLDPLCDLLHWLPGTRPGPRRRRRPARRRDLGARPGADRDLAAARRLRGRRRGACLVRRAAGRVGHRIAGRAGSAPW